MSPDPTQPEERPGSGSTLFPQIPACVSFSKTSWVCEEQEPSARGPWESSTGAASAGAGALKPGWPVSPPFPPAHTCTGSPPSPGKPCLCLGPCHPSTVACVTVTLHLPRAAFSPNSLLRADTGHSLWTVRGSHLGATQYATGPDPLRGFSPHWPSPTGALSQLPPRSCWEATTHLFFHSSGPYSPIESNFPRTELGTPLPRGTHHFPL